MHALEEAGIQRTRLLREQLANDFDAVGTQRRDACAVDQRIGIAGGIDDAPHLRGGQRIDTRRRASHVHARLERHVGGRADCGLPRHAQRIHLRVRGSGPLVPALPHHSFGAHQHAADARIRVGRVQTARRERERALHVMLVRRPHAACLLRLVHDGSRRRVLCGLATQDFSPASVGSDGNSGS